MAQNDLLKRYLDAGLELGAMTQARAEALVRDLVKAGEVQADQARDLVGELLERSRKNTERIVELVREEVKAQITNLGLASKADVERVEQRILRAFNAATEQARKAAAAAERSTSRRASGAKTTATKKASGAKRTAAKKASGAKKTAGKKASGAKKTASKKASGAKKAAKRSTKKATKRA